MPDPQVIHTLRTTQRTDTGQRYAYVDTRHGNLQSVLGCDLCRRLLAGGFKVLSAPEADARDAARDWGVDLRN